MNIQQQIAEIDAKVQETEDSIAGTRGALQDCLRVVLPIIKDQQKVLTALASELDKKEVM